MTRRNLMGHKSGYLEVIGPAKTVDGRAQWECRCVCGKTIPVSGESLTRKDPKKNSRSCGCMREITHTHTVIQRMKDEGILTPRIDERAVGRQEERLRTIEVLREYLGGSSASFRFLCDVLNEDTRRHGMCGDKP